MQSCSVLHTDVDTTQMLLERKIEPNEKENSKSKYLHLVIINSINN